MLLSPLRIRAAVGARIAPLMITLALAATGPAVTTPQAARATPSAVQLPAASTVVVAHEDDDLLFLNPDILQDLRAGRKIRTVFVTAGDKGKGPSYWGRREEGEKAAYARMTGVTNTWRASTVSIVGHPIRLVTLVRRPTVSLVFMRLPSGHGEREFESLRKLWVGAIGEIDTVDGSTSYTKASLQQAIRALMSSPRPDVVRTQDYREDYGDGDHSDHHTVGYITRAASAQLSFRHVLVGYEGYDVSSRPSNLSAAEARAKQDAFFTYSAFDKATCKTLDACRRRSASRYYAWLFRQYTVNQRR